MGARSTDVASPIWRLSTLFHVLACLAAFLVALPLLLSGGKAVMRLPSKVNEGGAEGDMHSRGTVTKNRKSMASFLVLVIVGLLLPVLSGTGTSTGTDENGGAENLSNSLPLYHWGWGLPALCWLLYSTTPKDRMGSIRNYCLPCGSCSSLHSYLDGIR